MTRYLLKSIAIEGFRGINNDGNPLVLSFDTNSVNSIFASNAQGKSSIYEAVYFALRGEIPKLAELQEVDSPNDYYVNQFHSSDTATIDLVLCPDDSGPDVSIRVDCNSAGVRTISSPSGHTDPEGFIESLYGPGILVDQSTFQRFIEDSPLDRGRSFSALLGLDRISEVRRILETLANNGTIDRDFGVDELTQEKRHNSRAEKALIAEIADLANEFLGQAPDGGSWSDLEDISKRSALALKSIALLSESISEDTVTAIGWDEVDEAIRSAEHGEDQSELIQLGKDITFIDSNCTTEEHRQNIKHIDELVVARTEALEKTRGPIFKTLYENALSALDDEGWNNANQCPVCEWVHADDLQPELHARLEDYQAVIRISDELSDLWQSDEWVKRMTTLGSSELAANEELNIAEFSSLLDLGAKGELSPDDWKRIQEIHISLAQHIQAISEGKGQRKKELEETLPASLVQLTQQVGKAKDLAEKLRLVEKYRTANLNVEQKLKIRERWRAFVRRSSNVFADAEVRLSTHLVETLKDDYEQFYEDITKNPSIVPKLQKSAVGEQLNLILGKFYTLSDVPATPLLSESYRNAFAIAIYLSAVLLDKSGARFIMLDDITSSFDAGHQFYLMEVLRSQISVPDNSTGPQVILLSHDGLLEKYFDRISTGSDVKWKHQRISGNPPQGDVLTNVQQARRHRESASKFLDAGQIEPARPFIRDYLEFRLEEIVRSVSIPVPYDVAMKPRNHTVQNYLDAITSTLSLHHSAGTLILTETQRNDAKDTHVPAIIANWLAHHSTGSGASLSPFVLKSVLDSIDSLVDCFRYDCTCQGTSTRRFYRAPDRKPGNCSC